MIDVQFDTVLLSPSTANAVKVVSTEHVVAHGSRDLSVLGIVGYATVLIFQAALLTCLLSFRLLVIFDKHRDDNFTAPENSSENQDRLKAIEDVRKYATVDFPVMEISITDDIANAGDTRKILAERITGTGHATRFAGREWLYSPAAKKILKRSWHIEAEPSDKPLRHKGTDLVRLETPLPAITVYAVKGAPTGETSWDNIDLTLREISEATVEKQEEALRKKRSLSSRCPSYKNSAPAGRQIKQTEDTGFETPTKPHGILGRLKGLFGKFRK